MGIAMRDEVPWAGEMAKSGSKLCSPSLRCPATCDAAPGRTVQTATQLPEWPCTFKTAPVFYLQGPSLLPGPLSKGPLTQQAALGAAPGVASCASDVKLSQPPGC